MSKFTSEVVDAMPARNCPGRKPGVSVYASLIDGRVHKISGTSHVIDCAVQGARTAARKAGKRVKSVKCDGFVYVQAVSL